jgi:hypothetical protein
LGPVGTGSAELEEDVLMLEAEDALTLAEADVLMLAEEDEEAFRELETTLADEEEAFKEPETELGMTDDLELAPKTVTEDMRGELVDDALKELEDEAAFNESGNMSFRGKSIFTRRTEAETRRPSTIFSVVSGASHRTASC